MIHSRTDNVRLILGVAFATSILLATGCTKQLKTGYGRSRGTEYTSSINGTVVLDKMVKSSNRGVDHYRKVSPRWYGYDTIFWIPDDFDAPRQDAINKAEEWLGAGGNKTLVYVARDYDASIVYWDKLRKSNTANERIARDYADALSKHISKSTTIADKNCDWYEWSVGPFKKASEISGTLAEDLDTSQAEIHYGSLPVPGDITDSGTFKDYDVEVLLTADSKPLVFSLTKEDWYGSRIIVVGNGSLVLNLPLTNIHNQELSGRLLEKVDETDYQWNDVLFVENQGTVIVSDVDVPEQTSKWSWITEPPLRYMVPNLVFWCMLFCFVYFPIFGRPRHLVRKSTADFRDHIFALARLVAGTENRENPKAWLQQYRNHSHRKNKKLR